MTTSKAISETDRSRRDAIVLENEYDADLVEALSIILAGNPAADLETEIPGVRFDDDGMRVWRQPWMSDEQWTTVHTRMTAWWNASAAHWMASR